MRGKIRKLLRPWMETLGSVSVVSYFLKVWRDRKYTVERALIADMHNYVGTHASIIHFTFNKAASTYVKSIGNISLY